MGHEEDTMMKLQEKVIEELKAEMKQLRDPLSYHGEGT